MSQTNIWAWPNTVAWQKWNIANLHPYALISGVYVLAALITRPLFQGDTMDYAGSVVAHMNGGYYYFWDFGHLFWRPVGLLVFRIAGTFLVRFVGPDPYLRVALGMVIVSWVAGLVSALLLLALLRLYGSNGWAPEIVAVSFVFSLAELDYSRTGSSYVPGLALMILAVYLIARQARNPSPRPGMSALAGLVLAGSVSLWFLFALAAPAAIVFPLVTEGFDKARLRTAVWVCGFLSLGLVAAYTPVLVHLRLSTVGGVIGWVIESSHGTAIRGVSRMIFGLPRSFVTLGALGKVIKRYLLRDPFNPVSGLDIFKLWPDIVKFGLFYLATLITAVSLYQDPRGRRVLVVTGIAALPVLGFGVYWSGADAERYLPLYPFFFLALCLSLSDGKVRAPFRAIIGLLLVCIVATNAIVLRTSAGRQIEIRAEDRIGPLLPELKEGSRIILSHNLDSLLNFRSDFPFSPVNQRMKARLYPLVTLGDNEVPLWPARFASNALSTWQKGGDVWVSRRLLNETPRADWNWVEGDDRRVSWKDFESLFSQLRYGEAVGGEDGFLQLLRSPNNEAFLISLTSK